MILLKGNYLGKIVKGQGEKRKVLVGIMEKESMTVKRLSIKPEREAEFEVVESGDEVTLEVYPNVYKDSIYWNYVQLVG